MGRSVLRITTYSSIRFRAPLPKHSFSKFQCIQIQRGGDECVHDLWGQIQHLSAQGEGKPNNPAKTGNQSITERKQDRVNGRAKLMKPFLYDRQVPITTQYLLGVGILPKLSMLRSSPQRQVARPAPTPGSTHQVERRF